MKVATLTVDCDAGEKVQQKIALAKPGESGWLAECAAKTWGFPSEAVRITLDGQGKTGIEARGNTADAILSAARTLRSGGSRSLVGGTAFIVRCRRGCFGHH